MVLDELLTPSEFRLVMDDIQNFPSNLVENSVQLFNDQPEVCGSSQTYDSDNSESKPKRKKPKRMCDSTYGNPTYEAPPAPPGFEMLPCLDPFPGQFDFHLQLPMDSSAHRWTFSKVLKKVFIDIDKVLALQFRWNYADLKPDSEFFVRAMPVYTSHDSLKIPVIRCPIHLLADNSLNAGFPHVEHVMRCEHSSTTYVRDPATKRFSCITPLSRPQPGSDTTTLTYKFVCKTSCLGGMNRKPVSVIFTLEDIGGNEYGRQLLAVKICSCPKRDKAKEEKNEQEKAQSCARVPKPLDVTPTMMCVRTLNSASHSQVEAIRDLKNVNTMAPYSLQSPSDTFKDTQVHIPAARSTRIEKDDIESIRVMQRELMETMNRLNETLLRTERQNQSSFLKISSYIETQLHELPPAIVLELLNDFTKKIAEKKILILSQNMMSYGPTQGPAPTSSYSSVTSSFPVNDWRG